MNKEILNKAYLEIEEFITTLECTTSVVELMWEACANNQMQEKKDILNASYLISKLQEDAIKEIKKALCTKQELKLDVE